MRRETVLAIGVLIALAGLVIAQSPSLAPSDAPDIALTSIAAVAMVAGLYRAQSWLDHDPREHAPAECERPSALPVPGDQMDRRLRRAPGVGAAAGDLRLLSVRKELREAAIEVLTRFQGYSEEEAKAALDDGSWTDDEVAAEFFLTRSGTGNSVREAVTGTFYGQGPFHRRAARAAGAIEQLTRGDRE